MGRVTSEYLAPMGPGVNSRKLTYNYIEQKIKNLLKSAEIIDLNTT